MNLWIADIDGVFTNLLARPNREAIFLSAQIGSRDFFAFVTGRAARWLEQNILPTLEEAYQQHPQLFPVICAEYGGVILRYYKKVGWRKEFNTFFPPLNHLRQKVLSLISDIPGVFYDLDKEIMISIEAQHSMRDTQYDVVEKGLKQTERILKELAANSNTLEYQRTTYACDLVPRGLNKAYTARFVLDNIGFTPHHVCLLGDAPSDLLLADVMIERRIPYTIYYVGDPSTIARQKEKYSFQLPKDGRYDQGTVEILQSFL